MIENIIWLILFVAVGVLLVSLFRQMSRVKHLINSRMDEMLELMRTSSLAKGRLEGIEEQKRATEPPK